MRLDLPKLYSRDSQGRLREWHVRVEGHDVVTTHGLSGGKMQVDRRAVEGNVLRSDEAQAQFVANSLWENKRTRKYHDDPDVAGPEVLLPMLAHPVDWKKVTWPMLVQPKLDGFRCLASMTSDGVRLTSRDGREFSLSHVSDALRHMMDPGDVWDGELYEHGRSLQEIASEVKAPSLLSHTIGYHVFDAPVHEEDDSLTFKERWKKFLAKARRKIHFPVHVVPTHEVPSMEQATKAHDLFVDEGYEGAILRDPGSLYQFARRSRSLLKIKSFVDDEFVVIGHERGRGREAGAVVWICETKQGKIFKARAVGSIESRRLAPAEADGRVGSLLTVKYQRLTDEGVPYLPVAMRFRADI